MVSSATQVGVSSVRRYGIVGRLAELNDKPAPRIKRAAAHKTLVWLVWLYVLAVGATWLLLWQGGDRWWFATLMMFGPRWIYALPLVVLIPAALVLRRRLLWPLGLSAVVIAGPVMGFCVPWQTFGQSKEPTIRVLTWNVENHCADTETLASLIAATKPDVVVLQECCTTCLHPDWPPGWHVRRQTRLITGSRYPIRDSQFSKRRWPPSKWPADDALRCVIETPDGPVGLVNVHLGTPREGISAVLNRRTLINPSNSGVLTERIECRRLESEELVGWIGNFSKPVIIAGDFNMPADSTIYRRTWSQYTNAFSTVGLGYGYSKQTEVMGREYGSRIDHILTGPTWRPCRSWLGPDLGSDHLPLIADLATDEL